MPILPLIVDEGATIGVIMAAGKDADMPHFLDGFEGGVTDATARIELYLATYEHCTFPHSVYGVTDLTIDESNRTLIGGATFKALASTAHTTTVNITGNNNAIIGLTVDPRGDDVTVTGDRAGWKVDGDNNKLTDCYAINGDSNSASRGFRNVGDQNVFTRCETHGGYWIGFSNNGTTSGDPRPRATYRDIVSTGAISRPFDHDFNSVKIIIDGAHLETDSTDASLIGLGLSAGATRNIESVHCRNVFVKLTAASHPDGQPVVKIGEADEVLFESCDFIRTNVSGTNKSCLTADQPVTRLIVRDSYFKGRVVPGIIDEYLEFTRCRMGDNLVATGTAQAGTPSSTEIQLEAAETFADDELNGMTVYIVSGTGAGQSREITDYVGSTDTATVAAWTTTPDITSVYEVRSYHSYVIEGMDCPRVRLEGNTFTGFDVAGISWKVDDAVDLISLYAKNNTCIGDSTTSAATSIGMFTVHPGEEATAFITPSKYNVTYTEVTNLDENSTFAKPCRTGDGRICMGDGNVPGHKDWDQDPTVAGAATDLVFTYGDIWYHNNGIDTEATGWMITTAGTGTAANPTELGTITEL